MSPAAPLAPFHHRVLRGEEATRALAQRLAPCLRAGDTLLLEGPIGAGKTALARALIQACQAAAGQPAEEVPSPTFTLVQEYEAGDLAIWHTDLYRLSQPEEALELGLDEAMGQALCLIEWPDRLGPFTPADALRLTLEATPDGQARRCALSGGSAALRARLAPILEPDLAHPSGAPANG